MKSHSKLKRDGVIATSDIWKTYCEIVEEMTCGLCYPKDPDPKVMGAIIIGGDPAEATAAFLGVEKERVSKIAADMLDPVWSEVYYKLIFPLEIAYADMAVDCEDNEPGDDYNYLMYDPFSNLYKIGRSINPTDRVASINRAIPPGRTEVELVYFFWTDKSVESEQTLHDQYEDVRADGEWFKLESEDVDYFKNIDCYKSGEFIMLDKTEVY